MFKSSAIFKKVVLSVLLGNIFIVSPLCRAEFDPGQVANSLLFQNQSASTPAAPTDPKTSSGEVIPEILGMLNPNPAASSNSLSDASQKLGVASIMIVYNTMKWTSTMYKTLLPEAQSIALTLLWAVLFAEITFTGFRLMLGSSIVEQLGLLTTKTFIYVIVSGVIPFPGAPPAYQSAEGIIRMTMFRLMDAGRYIGSEKIIKACANEQVISIPEIASMNVNLSEIPSPNGAYGVSLLDDGDTWCPAAIRSGPASSMQAEPLAYWLNWLGVAHAPLYLSSSTAPGVSTPLSPTNEYKYSKQSLTARIWGVKPGGGPDKTQAYISDNKNIKVADVADAAEKAAASFMMASMPLQMFGLALTVAGIQIGSLITIAFAEMSMLVGSIVAFNIASLLGVSILPLMYFRTFDKIWSQFLISLASLALVPFFFYFLSAVGFVFSTYLFELLFPLPSGDPSTSIAMVLNDMFFSAVSSVMNSYGVSILSTVGAVMLKLIGLVIAVYINLGRCIFGSTIVAAFITAGSLFSLLAPSFAFRWQSAFGAEEVMSKIGEVFNGLQSSIGSGMGQMYADAIQRGGNTAKGIGRGALKG